MKTSKPLNIVGLLVVMLCVTVVRANAQACDPEPEGGGESIAANIVERDTGAAVSNGSTIAGYTFIKIHSVAEAQGKCYFRTRVEGVCVRTGFYWERTVNHTSVYADIVSTGLNGHYFIGNVYGMNPNGTGADWHVLDTHNSDNTGPNSAMPSYPGSYTYSITAYINTTPCEMDPDHTDTVTITVYVSSDDEEEAALVQAPRRLPDNYIRIRNGGLFGEGWRWLLNKPTV